MTIYENPWFQVSKPVSEPIMRLFCFPYAGGSAHIYHDWYKFLPPNIEVVGVQYPGRGMRFSEPPITSCEKMLAILLTQIQPYLDRPFSFFGHSNGGLISFELARALQRNGVQSQCYQFISGKRAIHLPHKNKILHRLSEHDFVNELVELGGTPEEMLRDPEVMALFTPVIRADFTISETFTFQGTEKLHCNTSLLYGTQDKDIPSADVLRWQELIVGDVDSQAFDGHHFFINSHKQDVLALVNERLLLHSPNSIHKPAA